MGWRTQKRGRVFTISLVTVVTGILATLAVVWPGYTEQETPIETGSVWALQTGDGTRYARVNTDLGELDTVRSVENPSQLVQSQNALRVYTEANARFAEVNLALPVDVDEQATEQLQRTPQGTIEVLAASGFVVYRTETGAVYVSRLDQPTASAERVAFGGDDAETIDAIALRPGGVLAGYSARQGSIQLINLETGSSIREDAVPNGPDASDAQLALKGDVWFLMDARNDRMWTPKNDAPLRLRVSDQARLELSAETGDTVFVADVAGLWSVTAGEENPKRVLQGEQVSGTPAAPVTVNGSVYAAWLGSGSSSGVLWSSDAGLKTLSYGGGDIGETPLPQFQVSGNRAILNDTKSGWVWRVPNGDLVRSSQSWTSDQTDNQAEDPNDQQAEQTVEPKPPVAVDDSFGVRAGSQLTLQVMLNDSDPNEDVLSVIPESLQGLDASFGTMMPGKDSQTVVLSVAASASGSASFNYQLTDGTATDGLNSNTATVTLNVVPQDVNRAPVWCGVEACLAEWPVPEVAPGQTASTEVLAGWVDPDGDQVFVSGANLTGDSGTVTWKPQGSVVYAHPDPNLDTESNVSIDVTVSDDRGATATKPLAVRVTPTPSLTAASFAVSGVTGQPLTVFPLEHVTGITGVAQLTSVESLDSQRSSATLNSNGSSYEFVGKAAGSYLVRYTVRDDLAERTGVTRVIVRDAEKTLFSAVPLTVFVWPQADATVDLLSGISNPTGRVLSVSHASPDPLPTATMSADVISQQYLRVSGGTDSGEAGLLGRVEYEITDAASGQRGLGLVTVMGMPAAAEGAPIAVDDRVTVRVGAQVDIPVLANDFAVPGSTLTLDPNGVTNGEKSSLAFASGNQLRYLAPNQAGTYQLSYRISTAGSPGAADTAQVVVTVLAEGMNRQPQPRALSGRVLSGDTVRIPFDSFGIDPDGDTVVLDQILTQPESGSAAISADGTAIEYTSLEKFSGQVSFTYQVRDSLGDVGSAPVAVSVRDAQPDPTPVVFTDFVQVQAGAESTITVEPLANDLDPMGEVLQLTEVKPNAVTDSPEYAELADRIVSVSKSRVILRAGTVLGSASFTYGVKTKSGNTATGLIVVRVVRDPVVDVPVVTDTILDLETRAQFPQGVDVVTGKVSWQTGKVSSLTLALWGNPSGVSASGWEISGALPKKSRVIPFSVAGPNVSGDEVTSYGFLRVPGEDDLRLALRPNLPELRVNEGEQLEIDLSKLVLAPADAELQILESGVRASGYRKNSSCAFVSQTTIRYTAAKGAPWHDSCTVPIRLASQSVYTYLSVPIEIEADKPQPELSPASVTVSPGESLTYDLKQMVSWTGGEDWAALRLEVEPGGTDFTLELSGTSLSIIGSDRVKPGVQQTATIRVTSHQDVSPATLTVRAGPAPSTLPQGATVTSQCSQGDGSSCEITVVGAPGEINPFKSPLELVSVLDPALCPNVSFAVASPSTIRASWTDEAVGAQCTASFVVKDAQERQSLGDRVGSVTLDLLGYPQAPSSLLLKSFGDRTVTLAVNPGLAANAYPALEGFVILRDGEEVSRCGSGGQDCSPITGLTNGEPVRFEVRSVNSVGQSKLANPTLTTWSYRVPTIDSVTATPTYSSATTVSKGVVEIAITTNDSEVRAFTVSGVNGEFPRTGTRTVVTALLPVTTSVIAVTPLSQFDEPNGSAGAGSSVSAGVTVAGLPVLSNTLELSSVTRDSITTTALTVDANGSARGTQVIYVAYQSNGSATCSVDASGGSLSAQVVNGAQSSTSTISGLQSNVRYTVKACASNGFGLVESTSFLAIPFDAPDAPTGYTFAMSDGSQTGNYLAQITTSTTPPAGFNVVYARDTVRGQTLDITARYCLIADSQQCGPESAVTPTDSSQTVQFVAQVTAKTCAVGSPAGVTISADGVSGEIASVKYQAGSPTWLELAPQDPIPSKATSVEIFYKWTTAGTTTLNPFRVQCTP